MDPQPDEVKLLNTDQHEQRIPIFRPNCSEVILLDSTRPKSSKLTKLPNTRDKSQPAGTRARSPPEEGPSIHDVRRAFQVGLNKISQSQTREIVRHFFIY